MLEESKCPLAQRYLAVIGQYSASRTPALLTAVKEYHERERQRFDDRATARTEEFLAFATAFKGVVLQTLYCHADVSRGRAYDLVFDLQRPDRIEFTQAVVQYNVIWGQVASAGLIHGWHQMAFFEFPSGVPELVASLPEDYFGTRAVVGLCDSESWEAITRQFDQPM